MAGIGSSEMVGDALVLNMQFDRENLQLTQLSSDIDAGEAGTFGLLLTSRGGPPPPPPG